MKELMQNIGFALLGVLVLGFGCISMGQGSSAKAVIIVVLGAVLVLGYGCMTLCDMRGMVRARKAQRNMGCPAIRKLQLPYHVLVTRMQALAAVDDGAQVFPGYLSWSSQSFADIRIRPEGAENWVALFWLRSEKPFKNKELLSICAAEEVALPAEFVNARPHGLLVYKSGVLSVYPAELLEDCEAAFMENIFAGSEEAFGQWLEEQR